MIQTLFRNPIIVLVVCFVAVLIFMLWLLFGRKHKIPGRTYNAAYKVEPSVKGKRTPEQNQDRHLRKIKKSSRSIGRRVRKGKRWVGRQY